MRTPPNKRAPWQRRLIASFRLERSRPGVPERGRSLPGSPTPTRNAIHITVALIGFSLALGTHAGDITGKITLTGTTPPERTVDLTRDATLAAKHPNGLTTRHYRVSPEGGLQHVLVYIRSNFVGVAFEPPPATAVLDHANGLFQPYVVGIRVGQPLQLKCSDHTSCSFVALPKVNQSFSVAAGRATVPIAFSHPEVPVRLKCDLHPWNYAHLGVFSHPYFAVTDERGRFTIRGVPAGQYTLEIFHPHGGTSAKPIVVTGRATAMDFEVTAK